MARREQSWGFDTRDIDKRVRPQDDFFHYANGGWLKRNKIPQDEPRWGTFSILRRRTEQQLKSIVDTIQRDPKVRRNSEAKQVRDLYASAMNMSRRNALGLAPIRPLLKKIERLQGAKEIIALIPELHRDGISVLWGVTVDVDEKNAETYILHLFQSGLGLPERDYYLVDKPEQMRVRTAYQMHLVKMFALAGFDKKRSLKSAEQVFAIEKPLAAASMRRHELRDPHKIYHKLSVAGLARLSPSIPWRWYLNALGIKKARSLNVMQPRFMKTADRLLRTMPLEAWKSYLTWHVLASSAYHLSDPFLRTQFDFYGRVLTGSRKLKPSWRRALAVTEACLGEALGKLYVKKHFPPEAKRKIDELISNLFTVFEDRIQRLDWMSSKTKRQAIKKLHMIDRKIAYPRKWKSYRGLRINRSDYFGNVLRSTRYEHRRNVRRLGRPIDRLDWYCPPQTVNAFYNPPTNEILFPAGILQPPYFGPKQDDAINYGAIGGVIGHEITHGFDDEGSKFDAHGNLKNWWTKTDRRRFEHKARVVKRQFERYTYHGLPINGKLTLGENIADLGGYAIALEAYGRHIVGKGTHIIDNFTPLQRFFLGAAQDWRELTRPEIAKTAILIDPHAPHIFRMNGPASNLSEFYEAFGVKKGDRLYRSPKARAKIW